MSDSTQKILNDYIASQNRRKRLAKIDCLICMEEAIERGDMNDWDRWMLLCPICGNKRCPKATWHGNPCTHSNEPGQIGSMYGRPPYKLERMAE